MPWGLSSLGRSEARVLPNLDAVIATLHAICRTDGAAAPSHPPLRAFFRGDRLLQRNVDALFGAAQARRRMRIMVTLPTEAAEDAAFVRDLVERGMDCARINCAHDTPIVWERMIANIRQATLATGRTCRVLMDIAGPKPRTADLLSPPDARLTHDDRLLLTRGQPIETEHAAFQARCTLPEILDQVQVGEMVWIDEGRLGTRVEALLPQGLLLRVTQVRSKGEKLRSGKGLNFPDTRLHSTYSYRAGGMYGSIASARTLRLYTARLHARGVGSTTKSACGALNVSGWVDCSRMGHALLSLVAALEAARPALSSGWVDRPR
jgi:pyruvate kinase